MQLIKNVPAKSKFADDPNKRIILAKPKFARAQGTNQDGRYNQQSKNGYPPTFPWRSFATRKRGNI